MCEDGVNRETSDYGVTESLLLFIVSPGTSMWGFQGLNIVHE